MFSHQKIHPKVWISITFLEQLTVEVGKLKVVVVQGQVVLHRREAARPGGEVTNALVFTVQHLSEVI